MKLPAEPFTKRQDCFLSIVYMLVRVASDFSAIRTIRTASIYQKSIGDMPGGYKVVQDTCSATNQKNPSKYTLQCARELRSAIEHPEMYIKSICTKNSLRLTLVFLNNEEAWKTFSYNAINRKRSHQCH